VDALERFVVGAAQRVILNTEAARRTYAAHYRDLGGERFACIPNHADPSLHRGERPPPRQRARFELLFAGTLRRFVEGEVLLDLLSELRERGFEPKRVGLSIVGSASDGLLSRALERGLGPYLSLHEPVSYLDVPARQQRADLLVVLGHRDAQRIPAKIYDAALSDRPVLVVSSSPELSALTETIGGARAFAHQDVTSMADWVSELVEAGGASVKRDFAWDSRAASARLATVLRAAASRSVA
jgi:hypothetical protein